MENLSNHNETSFTFRREVWINDIVFKCIFITVSLYLLTALVYYRVKIEKSKKKTFMQLTLEQKYVVLSKYTCITIAAFSVFWNFNELALDTLEGFAGFSNKSTQLSSATEVACNVLKLSAGITISCGNFFVYVFLWLRQSVFYVHSSLKILYNTCLKVFSFSVLIIYFLFGVCLLSAYFIKVRYTLNQAGVCQFQVENGGNVSYLQILIAWAIASILMQILLLGLFIYPILKQSSWQKKFSIKGKKEKSLKNVGILKRVKKAVILASVCLATDVLTVVALKLLFDENANSSSFIYDINLAINHLVTIVCFDHWKKMLWPWNTQCLRASVSTVDEASTSSQQTTVNRCSISVVTVTTV